MSLVVLQMPEEWMCECGDHDTPAAMRFGVSPLYSPSTPSSLTTRWMAWMTPLYSFFPRPSCTCSRTLIKSSGCRMVFAAIPAILPATMCFNPVSRR